MLQLQKDSSFLAVMPQMLLCRISTIKFVETYSDAKFFVIKSYSEDDVHKSFKCNVWASTPNGNK